ncbi:MAG: hypothetical protein LBV79_06110 [Candidatus Adiutrix sp.]|jgi:hypothetical protein|nr:hypothetical protein [Candidatus Adiutrix sp.]
MKKNLAKLTLCSALAIITLTLGGIAAAQTETKMAASAATLKRMSVFLSNFTELGFWEIESPAAMAREDLVRFGIGHNYINNFKSRIVQKKSQNGDLAVDGKWVAESVKKYFDVGLKHGSVMESDPPYYYDGTRYHFYGADGEAIYYARVREAFQLPGGHIKMTGELYNADGNDEATYPFEAVGKPYKFGGKDTWSIISLHTNTD